MIYLALALCFIVLLAAGLCVGQYGVNQELRTHLEDKTKDNKRLMEALARANGNYLDMGLSLEERNALISKHFVPPPPYFDTAIPKHIVTVNGKSIS